MKPVTWILAVIALLLGGWGRSRADTIETFNLEWSGAAYGNTATATGQITLDTTLLPNPTGVSNDSFAFSPPLVQAFSITITGASSGNGTFTESNFGSFYWSTFGGTLDFTHELVGQPTSGPPWASTAGNFGSGDFNIFRNGTNPNAPNGTSYFQLRTNGGSGDPMNLTSFTPASAVPEPTSLVTFGLVTLAGAAYSSWRRRKQPAQA